MDLSIVILTSEEVENIQRILPEVKLTTEILTKDYEILIIDNNSRDGTDGAAQALGAQVIKQKSPGFGNALKEGFREAKGNAILTLDADFSHPPEFILSLWNHRKNDIVIASRWVKGDGSDQSSSRKFLSLFMNIVFRAVCGIETRDLNSNFRLYRREAIASLPLEGTHFEILPEILIKARARGYTIKEVPFHYRQRKKGSSKLRILTFGYSYFIMLLRLALFRFISPRH